MAAYRGFLDHSGGEHSSGGRIVFSGLRTRQISVKAEFLESDVLEKLYCLDTLG